MARLTTRQAARALALSTRRLLQYRTEGRIIGEIIESPAGSWYEFEPAEVERLRASLRGPGRPRSEV